MHLEHHVGPGQVEQVRVAGHVLRVIAQPAVPVVGRAEAGRLQHRAPGAVEHHDALVQKLAQGLACPVADAGIPCGHLLINQEAPLPGRSGRAWRA